jgi:hypothetical protein
MTKQCGVVVAAVVVAVVRHRKCFCKIATPTTTTHDSLHDALRHGRHGEVHFSVAHPRQVHSEVLRSQGAGEILEQIFAEVRPQA